MDKFVNLKKQTMGLLTPKGKKGDKKSNNANAKNSSQGSKFMNKNVNSGGFVKKQKPGSANRGS